MTCWRVLTRIRLSYRRRSRRKTNFQCCLLVYFQVARFFFFKRKKHNTSGATFLNIIDLRPGSSSNITASSSSFLYFFSADTRIRTYNNNRQVDSSQPHQPPPEIFFIFFSFLFLRDENKVWIPFCSTDRREWLAGTHWKMNDERKWKFFFSVSSYIRISLSTCFFFENVTWALVLTFAHATHHACYDEVVGKCSTHYCLVRCNMTYFCSKTVNNSISFEIFFFF